MFAMFSGAIFLLVLLVVVSSGVLLFLLPVALIACARRKGNAGSCRANGPRWWPWLLAAPLFLLLYFIGSIPFGWHGGPVRTHKEAHRTALRQQLIAQQAAAKQAIESALVEQQIARLDIHELMDRSDAPRITLAPEPPSAPPAPESQPTGEEPIAPNEPAEAPAPDPQSPEASHEKPAREPRPANDAGSEKEAVPADNRGEAVENSGGSEDGEKAAAEATAESARAASDETAEVPPAQAPEKTSREAGEELVVTVNAQAAAQRPSWVDAGSKRVGNTWRNVVVTDEFATKPECDREADRLLVRETLDHLRVLTGNAGAEAEDGLGLTWGQDRLDAEYLAAMGITIDYIRREIAKDEYAETVERSFGPMKKVYTLLEFTPAVDRELRARWDNYRRQERFAVVGGGAASVLALLGLAWALLQVDTLTKGYYTKRLFLGVPAAILGLLGLYLLAEFGFDPH